MKRFYATQVNLLKTTSSVTTIRIMLFLLILLGMLKSDVAKATHAAGADIAYQWISGNTYQVTCTFYRDCGGVAAPNTVTLRVRSASLNVNFTQTLQRLNPTGQEITFSCTGITNCSGGTQTGIQRYVYRGNVTLPGAATDWIFSYQVCCRNCSITTIVLPNPCNASITEPQLYVEATLNNIAAPNNSSPTFTVNPVAFICQNQLFNFNQGAVDINGDSLAYELITPKTSNTGTVTYIPPYNTTNFIASSPAATLSPTTGQIAMTPTILGQVGILALLVKEYRNGVLIGTTIRDIQIQIVNCSNQNPVISGVNGTSSYEIEVCAGDVVNFQVFASDPDVGQVLTLTWNNGIPAPATFTSSGVSNPTIGTFNWPTTLANGSTTPYTFVATVQDNGCFYNNVASFAYTIWVRHVTATIGKVDVSCFGFNNGSATVNPGGTGPFNYLWNTGATTQTITNLSPGTYTVTVTGYLGCSTTASVQINQPDPLDLTGVVNNNVSCFGGNDGSASVLVSGGTTPYSYLWSNAATTSTINGLTSGTYVVTVTDDKNCTASVSVDIGQSPQLIIDISSNQPAGCLGESTGALDITVSGGTSPYTYIWSNGATTEDINLLPANTYTVTVTDDLGCTGTQTAIVEQPTIPVPLITSTTIDGVNVTCYGAASGEASVSVSGGTAPYNYIWSNGSTDSFVTGLTAGIISVTVSDQNGCSSFASYEITQPPVPFIVDIDSISNYNGSNVSCDGNNDGAIFTSVSGGTGPFNYIWSNTETASSLTGLAPGTYSVTVTDFYGCTATNSATINPLDPLTVTLEPTDTVGFNINCNGEASGGILTAVAGGTGPYFYAWNNGATTASITELTAGTYTVTLSDINGCSATASITLTQPDTIVPLINSPIVSGGANLLCFGDSNASASVSVTGGTPPYTYLWSNGATDDFVNNLAAGIIGVTIQDQNDCSAFGSFTVTQPDEIVITLTPNPPLNCGGVDDAGILTTVTGGTGAYTFAWSNGATTQNLSNLGEGTYSLTVTDENNCSAIAEITFNAPPVLTASVDITSPSCNGDTNAFIIVTVADGTPDYTFLWSNGSTDDNISGIGAGLYSVTITDALGCSLVLDVNVTEPDVVSLNPIVTNVSCFGVFDGEIDANPSGGTTPFTFNWSNGSTDQINIALVADTYSVTATDANGCSASATVTVTEPTQVVVTYTVDPQNSCLGIPDGAIDLTVTGGTGPYSFFWFNESTDEDIDSLLPGSYFVTVTDANNCAVIVEDIVVTEVDQLSVTPVITQPNCALSYEGQISLTVSGGTAPYSYIWSNGSTDATLIATAGTYSVTVTDDGGCTATAGGLTIIECCNINLTANPFSPGCGTQLGSIDLDPAGAVTPVTYIWSNGATTEDIDNLVTGTYSVTVEDANGCTATGSWFVNAGGADITLDAVITQPICNGGTGSIFITADGGELPYTFVWSNGATDSELPAVSAGTYTVTVTDAFNCTTSGTYTIINPPAITITSTLSDYGAGVNVTCVNNNGSIDLNISNGTPPYIIVWDNAQTGAFIDGLAGGIYSATVTDDNGCSATTTITLIQSDTLIVTLTPSNYNGGYNISCNGATDGSINVNAAAGVAPFTYLWSTGSTEQNLINIGAGTYSVTVTDTDGCTGQAVITLTEPEVLTTAINIVVTDCNNAGQQSTTLNSTVSGGTPVYGYVWSTGATTTSIVPTTSGTYGLTITDANGCVATAEVDVNIEEPLTISVSQLNQLFCNSPDTASVQVSINSGVAPFNIIWNTGETTDILTDLGTGSYCVTVTDVNSCSASACVTISLVNNLTVSLSILEQPGCTSPLGSIQATPSNGTGPYSYVWSSSSQTTEVLNNVGPGTYTVTVTDAGGCTATANIILTPTIPIVISPEILVQPTCETAPIGSFTFNVTGGVAPYTISINGNPVNNGDTLFNLLSGAYNISVVDDAGCENTAIVSLQPNNTIAPVIAITNQITCLGGDMGAVDLNVTGGTTPYIFAWDNGATDEDLNGLTQGQYCVTVTDDYGCTASQCITLTNDFVLTSNITSTNITCGAVCNGTATVNPAGGVPPYTVAWSTGSTNNSIADLCEGMYYVTIFDDAGCIVIDSAEIQLPQPYTVILTTSSDTVGCGAAATAQITAVVIGAIPPVTYSWSTGATTSSINVTIGGTYTVTVNDGSQCPSINSISIFEIPTIDLAFDITDITGCAGDSTGAIELFISNGTPDYSVIWSNGSTETLLTNLAAGSYTVTVTDAAGCTVVNNVAVNEPAPVTLTFSIDQPIPCLGAEEGIVTVNATGGDAPYTYIWSNGDTDATADSLGVGVWNVTVTSANGCTAEGSITLNGPQPYTVTLTTSADTVGCGASTSALITAAVSGANPPVTYAWSNGATTSTINVTAGGTYTVTVNDGNQCPVIESISITEIPIIDLAFDITDIAGCAGDSTGAIELFISNGTPDYSVIWSNGSTETLLTNLAAGSYTVTVTDAAGCTVVNNVAVSEPAPVTMQFNVVEPVSCAGNADAVVTVTPTTGNAPFTYIWSNGDTDATADSLGVGTWSVTVTTTNGCTGVDSITITAPQPLQINATVSNPINCVTGTGGQISLTVFGGTDPFTYAWAPNDTVTSNVASNLSAGTYYFTVTDGNGCQNSDSLTLNAPTAITVITTNNNIVCGGTATGSISTDVNGGTAPYAYIWSNNATTANLSNVVAGVYCVTVTEAGGCTATACDTIVDINEPLSLSYSFGDTIACNGGCDADINLSIEGGVSPYTIIWSNGATTEDLSNVCAGNYTALVTDANGCTANIQVPVTQPQSLSVSLAVVNQPSCGTNNGCIAVSSVTAPAGTYNINWSGSGSNNDTLCGLAPGTYSVTITTIAGCTATASITLNQPTNLNITVNGLSPCFNQCNGGINATVEGGVAPYSFVWSNGQTASGTTSLITDLCAGNYTVTVTDVNGCSGTAQFNLTSQPEASVNAGPDQLICGQPNSTALNGTTNNIGSFSWTSVGNATLSATNVLTPTVNNLVPGANLFILTGNSGVNCVYSDTVVVTYVEISANAGPDASDCKKENLQLNATGQGIWSVIEGNVSLSSNTDPKASINNIAQGQNVLVWTVSQGGCTATDTVTLTLLPISECIDSIKIPTGFSPNGDGVNDYFQILGIELYPNNELTIFNRWGNVVYYKQNYFNEWNGNNMNGEPLPDATYFVIFTSEEKNYKYSGYVDLRRQ